MLRKYVLRIVKKVGDIMTTTIGSLDLNAFNDLYSDSTQYFWFEGNASATYGAGVHITLSPDTSFIANPTGQNILMNTDGISIRNGLLPMMTLDNDSLDFNMIDTIGGTYTNIATFGLQTRIGRNETGYSRILIDPSSDNVDLINAFEVLTPDDISAFSQKIDTTRTTEATTHMGYNEQLYPLPQGSITTTTNTITRTFSITDVGTISSGKEFIITFTSMVRFYGYGMVYTSPIIDTSSMNLSFTKGVAQTASTTITEAAGNSTTAGSGSSTGITHTVQAAYDGAQTFVVTSSAVKVSSLPDDYYLNTFLSKLSYEGNDLLMPVLFQSGDAIFCNEGVGQMYLDLNIDDGASATTDATSGDDMNLFNTIRALGWYNDVIENLYS